MQEELRIHKKDGRERLNIAIAHSSTRNLLSHALTPQCHKRRNEKKAREREEREREKWMRRREVKREGTRALCLILFILISTITVSNDSSTSRIIDTHICSFIFIDFIITIRILHYFSVCACRMHRRKEKQGSSILTTTWRQGTFEHRRSRRL